MSDDDGRLLSTGQAARYMSERGYQVSRFTVIRMVADGRLPSHKTPSGQARIERDALDRYVAKTQQ